MSRGRLLLTLFTTFFKIGLFTFGGGYAMIALIDGICVEKRRFITHDEMMNITALAESTPGPIAVNCATYVGWKQAGFLGAAFATLGVVLPSLIVMIAVAAFLDRLMTLRAVESAFRGIRVAVGLLIIGAAVNMMTKLKREPVGIVIAVCAFASMLLIDAFSVNFSSVALILIAALLGVFFYAVLGAGRGKGKQKKKEEAKNDPS